MNRYLTGLEKIEFVVTNACTGRCKHCSEGDHTNAGESINAALAADAVRKISLEYGIKTVMAFGGEPLLYPDTVEVIMRAASEMGIERRQVITNGYFSKDRDRMRAVAEMLAACRVNDLLVSVDAFHQETIPLDTVRVFAEEAVRCGIPVRLQPAWLVSVEDGNPYNEKTREILDSFRDMNITVGEGNVVFPEGNALKFLSEYFVDGAPINPYTEDPCQVKCLSFSANGDVLDGNIYERDIKDIINNYNCSASKGFWG